MNQYFYLTMLIAPILVGIISIAFGVIGKRPNKICTYVMYGLMVITIVSLIGFAVTLGGVN